MIVCICQNISDHKIRQMVGAGVTTMSQLRNELGVGTCCGKCHPHAKQVLRECRTDVSGMKEIQVLPLIFQGTPLAA